MAQEWDKLVGRMDEWTRAVDRFMDRMQEAACAQQPTPSLALDCWRPAVNIYETQEKVVVLVELAGIKPGDVTVQLDPRHMLIRGQRPGIISEAVQTLHQVEIWSGPFAFQVPLPTRVDPAQAEAKYHAGLLEVRAPKRLSASQESIRVRIHLNREALSRSVLKSLTLPNKYNPKFLIFCPFCLFKQR